MALTKNPAPQFEAPEDTGNESAADARVRAALASKVNEAEPEPAAEEAAPAAKAEPSKSTEVATKAANAVVSASSIMKANPFEAIKNALHVNFDELQHIKVVSGNVQYRKGNRIMGESIVLELISFQDQFVMSPSAKKDDKEAINYLKFSDDGVHVKGTNELLTDWRERAIEAGYTDSKIVPRVILVGAVVDGGKCPDLVNELVQLDLAPRSVSNFKTYQVNTAFRLGRGLIPSDVNPLLIRIKAVPQTKNGNDWTDAEFEPGFQPKAA